MIIRLTAVPLPLILRMITSGAFEAVCEQRGWQTVAVYDDPGVSDGKGRDEQPGTRRRAARRQPRTIRRAVRVVR